MLHFNLNLCWAAESGHKAMIQLLLRTGQADATLKDYWGRTPLSWAAEWGREKVIQVLLGTGQVDVSSTRSEG